MNVLGDVAGVHDSFLPALLAFLPIPVIFLLSRIRALHCTPWRLNLSNVCEYTMSKQSARYGEKSRRGEGGGCQQLRYEQAVGSIEFKTQKRLKRRCKGKQYP